MVMAVVESICEEEKGQLLQGSDQYDESSEVKSSKKEAPATWSSLPHKKQLLLLALCRLCSPLSNACLLPYIYYLVKSILVDPDQATAPQRVSRLTGVLIAAYPLGQMATSMFWGRISDTCGRRPIVLLGLAISVVSNLAFGFSRSMATLLFWRALAGMANGILGVMRTMTVEIVKEKRHQTRAFLALPVVFNSGRVAATAIGGCLADPVVNLPWFFGPDGLFNVARDPKGVAWMVAYPYALPALFNGVVLAICLLLATLGLRESLPSKEHQWDLGIMIGNILWSFFNEKMLRKSRVGYTPVRKEEPEVLIPEPPTSLSSPDDLPPDSSPRKPRLSLRKIWTPRLLKTLLAFGLLPLHNATFIHIFPIFLALPVTTSEQPTILRFVGGLGLASPSIGVSIAALGVCGILIQLFIYPRIQRAIGTLGAFRFASSIFPFVYLSAPYLALLAGHKEAKWPAMGAVLFTQVLARTMAIPSSIILLTEAAPQKNVLGTVHGAGNMLSSFASAVGPVLGGLILAWGIDIGVVGLVWWIWLLPVALVTLTWSFVLETTEME